VNSTKANAILQSGELAVFCPVSQEIVKADSTKRVDYEASVKDENGKEIRTTMKTLRVSPTVFATVLKALKTDGIEKAE